MLSSLRLAALAQHAHQRPTAWNVPRGHRVQTDAEYASYVGHLITFVRTPSPFYADVANAGGPMLKEDGTLRGTYTAPAGLTMQSEKALHQLRRTIESIIDSGIPGDIVETGTWRAGTAVFMVGVVQARHRPHPRPGCQLNRHRAGSAMSPPRRTRRSDRHGAKRLRRAGRVTFGFSTRSRASGTRGCSRGQTCRRFIQ